MKIKDIKDQEQENQIKSTEDEFNLCNEGKIEFSKTHSSANRPLNKIGDFNNNTHLFLYNSYKYLL